MDTYKTRAQIKLCNLNILLIHADKKERVVKLREKAEKIMFILNKKRMLVIGGMQYSGILADYLDFVKRCKLQEEELSRPVCEPAAKAGEGKCACGSMIDNVEIDLDIFNKAPIPVDDARWEWKKAVHRETGETIYANMKTGIVIEKKKTGPRTQRLQLHSLVVGKKMVKPKSLSNKVLDWISKCGIHVEL